MKTNLPDEKISPTTPGKLRVSGFAVPENAKRLLLRLDFWLLAFSMVIARAPRGFEQRDELWLWGLFLLPFLIAIALHLPYFWVHRPRLTIEPKLAVLFALFCALWITAFGNAALPSLTGALRNIALRATEYCVVGALLLCAWVLAGADVSAQSRLRRAVLYCGAVFVAVNLVLYALGYQSTDTGYLALYPAQVLSWLGITANRAYFALAQGINSFGLLAGLSAVALVPMVLSRSTGRIERLLGLLLGAACGIAMLLVDSRGPMLYSVMVAGLMLLPFRIFRFARWLPFGISVLPVLIMLVAPGVLLASRVEVLGRAPGVPLPGSASSQTPANEQDCREYMSHATGVLSNRPLIWEAALEEFAHPRIQHLVGFGFRGQIGSGVWQEYRCLFVSLAEPQLASVHNVWLQAALDVGYLGLGFTLVFLAVVLIRATTGFIKSREASFQGVAAVILFAVLAGTQEAALSPDHHGVFSLILLLPLTLFLNPGESIPD